MQRMSLFPLLRLRVKYPLCSWLQKPEFITCFQDLVSGRRFWCLLHLVTGLWECGGERNLCGSLARSWWIRERVLINVSELAPGVNMRPELTRSSKSSEEASKEKKRSTHFWMWRKPGLEPYTGFLHPHKCVDFRSLHSSALCAGSRALIFSTVTTWKLTRSFKKKPTIK